MAIVPIKAIKVAVQANKELGAEMDMVKEFAKHMFPSIPVSGIMSDIRKQMAANPSMELTTAAYTCFPVQLPFYLYATTHTTTIASILKGDFRESPLMQHAMRCFTEAGRDSMPGAVLFRYTGRTQLGVMVVHNIDMPAVCNPRVVIPASARGFNAMQIITAKYFSEDYLGERKEKHE